MFPSATLSPANIGSHSSFKNGRNGTFRQTFLRGTETFGRHLPDTLHQFVAEFMILLTLFAHICFIMVCISSDFIPFMGLDTTLE